MTGTSKPQYSATAVCSRYTEITLTQLYSALKMIAPSSEMGDWSGPFTTPPTDALGTDMITVDGVPLTLLNVDMPLPVQFFDPGPIPNHLMPDAVTRLRNNRAHVTVMPAKKPAARTESIATARSVTLLTLAVVSVTNAEAVKWGDAGNVIPVATLQHCAEQLRPARGMAVPLWVRILAGRAHGQSKIIAGSYGLWAFGLPEIEYAATDLPINYLIPHSYMACDHLLRTRPSTRTIPSTSTARTSSGLRN